ncbi:LD-carboxypeptidase [Glycomyces buryatensis]|uniref:LD-carboxypeptidase n=1 Tax=Glycomyces buryatensis TaxID=2570927 RepID=A0A4S8PXB9_9ACTN|nr:LD-carboxypeptidase [Glycomyces buryatensis]THV32879.1 LD-carboxypeptidase [Glycomyces buryatensis]
MEPLRRPRRLVAGDRVAVVAPSGPFPPEDLEAGMAVLRSWGLEPEAMPHALERHAALSYLAGGDRERAEDFQAAWSDPAYAAVISARGGYGTQRMLDLVDWSAMAPAEPKPYIGFSDATALHEAIALRLGVSTLHGPMPAWRKFIANAESQEHLRRTLFEPELTQKLTPASARTLVPGQASGVTFGGCISLLAAGIGTAESRLNVEGGILLLEEIEEAGYRLDRYLTQMRRAGWFDGVRGIALGSWVDCGPYEEIRATLLDRLGDLGVPVVEDFGFGHCIPSLTIPLGLKATLDADAGTLQFDTPALYLPLSILHLNPCRASCLPLAIPARMVRRGHNRPGDVTHRLPTPYRLEPRRRRRVTGNLLEVPLLPLPRRKGPG